MSKLQQELNRIRKTVAYGELRGMAVKPEVAERLLDALELAIQQRDADYDFNTDKGAQYGKGDADATILAILRGETK